MRQVLLGGCAAVLACGAAVGQSATEEEGDASEARETIIITGRAQQLYRVTETTTGKLPTDPLTSSNAIAVINADLIRDQGARDAQDLYRNISGVTLFSYAGVTARGFRQEEIFFDGLRGDPYAGFAVPQLFNVERVEFLKGPAGMLYGPGAPGGLFNYVTKKPQEAFSARVSLAAGTEARHGAAAEITGALPVDGAAGRLGVFYEDRNTFRKNTSDETGIYDAGLAFGLGFADLLVQATRYEQKLQSNRLRGVPVDEAGDFIADRRWNHNEPDDFLDLTSNNVSARLDGALGDGLTWDAALRYTESREDQEYHEPRALADTDGDGVDDTVSVREFRDQTRTEEQLSLGVNTIWSAQLGPVDNRLLVGYERFTGENELDYLRARGEGDGVAPLSILDPVYGLSDRSAYSLSILADGQISEQTRQGGYVLNEATLGKLTLVGGVRFDRFEDEVREAGVVEESFEDDAITGRAGVIYKLREDVSLFGQWAQSYEPQDAGDQVSDVGGPFDPTAGEIVEGGVKTALMDGRIQTTATVYHLTRTNILQNDPAGDRGGDGRDDFIAFGEVTSQGFEVDIAADISPDWVLTASYAYNDAKITED
ncbi:MAG: TonB-dependent receptor, partial [Caulobacterales bacterium]|nr:TonB-dependent receptor [Caulobacterales bacterium]